MAMMSAKELEAIQRFKERKAREAIDPADCPGDEDRTVARDGPSAPRLASLAKRRTAWLYDVLFVAMINVPFQLLLLMRGESRLARDFSYLMLPLLYGALLEGFFQATWGKMMVGIRVVSTARQRTLDLWQSFKRNFVKHFISGLFLFGYLMAYSDESRRTLHDRWADSLVVEE